MDALERPAWNPARQCTATSRSGERCQRQPIPGGSVCVLHGGSSPNVQHAAKMRLLAMVEPILATFEEILSAWHRVTCTGCGHVDENGVKCVGCGKPTGDPMPVIRIGQLVLDRAGFHPSLAVVQAPPHNPYEDLNEDELIAKTEGLLKYMIESRDFDRQREQPRLDAGVIDAVIDDGFEVPETDDAPLEAPPAVPSEPEAVWSIPVVECAKPDETPENARENDDE